MYVYLVLGSFCCLSVSFCHFPWKSLVYDVYVDSLPVLFFFCCCFCCCYFCCSCCFIWIFVSLMLGCFCFCPSLVSYSSIILNGLMCVMFFVCQIYRASNQLESDWNSMSASYTECSSFERCILGRYDRKSTIFN